MSLPKKPRTNACGKSLPVDRTESGIVPQSTRAYLRSRNLAQKTAFGGHGKANALCDRFEGTNPCVSRFTGHTAKPPPGRGIKPASKKGELEMNWDQIEGNWKQFRGKAKEQWGKLTDDEIDVMAGKRDQLIGKVQERYGLAKEEAERQVDDWSRQT